MAGLADQNLGNALDPNVRICDDPRAWFPGVRPTLDQPIQFVEECHPVLNHRFATYSVLICIVLSAAPAQAQFGWFGSSDTSSSSQSSAATSSWWQPWSSSKPASTEPSMLSKMGTSTKNSFSKTVDFLNPFDNKPAKPKPKAKSASSSWWPWGKSQEPQRETVESRSTMSQWHSGEMPNW
jgi:hypothetical protein